MKRKNFPGRKMTRKIEAEKRLAGTTAVPYTDEELNRIQHARAQRSKHRN